MATDTHNWYLILQEVRDALLEGCNPTFAALARELGIPRTTLAEGLERKFGIRASGLTELLIASEESKVKEEEGLLYKTTTEDHYQTLDIKLSEIKTLDEMLKICRVDLSVWEVERWLINKWPGYRRNEQKDITWTDGKADGFTRTDGKLTIEALFQVKVWLKRKVPLKPEIVLHPIELTITTSKPAKIERKEIETAVILPDMHFGFSKDINTGELAPFHDREALDVALQIVEYINPDKIVWLGDILDLPDWTDKFLRSPEFYWTTQSAVIEAVWWLTQFGFAGANAKKLLLFGNHDDRPRKAIISSLKSAWNLKPADELDLPPALSIERLLCLDKLGIEYVTAYPGGEVWINDDICCIHGNIARQNSLATVIKLISNSVVTKIQGHIHRIEIAMRKIQMQGGAKSIYGVSCGCLCKIDGSVPGSNKDNNWMQGLGVVHYSDDLCNTIPIPISIDQGKAVYDGVLFTARDQLETIKKDTNWDEF